MQEFITIEKDPNFEKSQDFALLKKLGLKHLEALASDLWTDYNEHDPGVTLLEVLAYAITDLGYRTGYDVSDIITAEDKALNNHKDTFHKALEILPCNQVTELDLREVLIDIEGVRNAWVKIATEFENTYHIDYDASQLSIENPVSTTEEEVTSLNGLYHIVIEFDRLVIPIDDPEPIRIEKERKVLDLAKERLMKYRNFCEDYFTGVNNNYKLSETPVTRVVTKPLGFERIVIWSDIEVTADSNKEKVHAQVYFEIEQFLIPYVTFYSLQERLAKSKTIDEIFEGPLLKNGFIDEDELDEIELRTVIHTSDLYQVIMDIPGVVAVKSLKIANYLSADGVEPDIDSSIEVSGNFDLKKLKDSRGEDWCLKLNSDSETCKFYELALDTVTTAAKDPINKTVKFYTGENSVPVSINTSKSIDELNLLRQNDRKRRERLGRTSFELEFPDGENLDIASYFPVQNEIPEVYGTGLSGLSENVTDERKGQAKQLKAYLLFFEQILSNYLAQLNNVRHLFSWDDTIDKTYYSQVLDNIKDEGELYLEAYDGSALSPGGILDKARLGELIQQDAEDANTFFDRRSRFLNHVIARFNEKFVEYSLIMHSLEMKDRTIPDKAKFLKEYDQISMNRGKGFDFSLMRNAVDTTPLTPEEVPDVWDTLNVTGYQHRISRFLGLSDQSRRFLYSGHEMRIEAIDNGGTIEYRYVLTINEETGLEIFGEQFLDDIEAIDQFDALIENEGKDNVTNANAAGVDFPFNIINADDSSELGTCRGFVSAVERDDAKVEITEYFNNVSAFVTQLVEDPILNTWSYTIEVSSATPPYFINGLPQPTSGAAQSALDHFMDELKADTLGFSLPSLGIIENNEFYFQITDSTGTLIAESDSDVFVGSRSESQLGMEFAETFFNDAIGYANSEGGLHVVEHILLRPKTANYNLFEIDVRQYDSIKTVENPPVAYPVDYDGVYDLPFYNEQYYLSSEVELTDVSQNASGEEVNVIEPYFYTISESQVSPALPVLPALPGDDVPTVGGTAVTWEEFLTDLRGGNASVYQLTLLDGEKPVDKLLWEQVLDGGFGCEYGNYLFGSIEVSGITFNYYFIMDGDTILGGLISAASVLTIEDVKERALRAMAYFCENTTCKGISNPYEFKATVVLPAWTVRARDYNYRAYSEETIRLEAPAHIALDIKWVNRSQMREFEICYREWLVHQGQFLHLDRQIQQDPMLNEVSEMAYATEEGEKLLWLLTPTDVSNSFLRMTESASCLIEKIDGLVDAFKSAYKTSVRNDQFFTNNASSDGTVLGWVSGSADGSIVNKAELVGGILPPFLGFFTGEEIETTSGLTTEGTFNAGDFLVVDYGQVTAGEWSFSVKTYRDSGEVSCTDVLIKIIPDIEATYVSIVECYSHLEIGDIITKAEDANGEIFSAELGLTSDPLPVFLLLLTSYAQIDTWIANVFSDIGLILDPLLYTPGDIVVIAPATHPINDPLAIPSEGNLTLQIVVKITDITGGITVFTNIANEFNTGSSPGFVPLRILGNGALHYSPVECPGLNVGTYNIYNEYYTNTTEVIMEFWDGQEINGVTLVSASILLPDLSGLTTIITDDGRAQIIVGNYEEFETYVASLLVGEKGLVSIPVDLLSVVDSCGFMSNWTGVLCIRPDTDAVVVSDVTSCSGKYTTDSIIARITDVDNGIINYEIDPLITAELATFGVGHQLQSGSSNNEVVFNIMNATLFLNAVEEGSVFDGTEIVDGQEINTYSLSVDTIDFYGGTSTLDVHIYAPVNAPLVCTKLYPDGTSYLAYLYNTLSWNSRKGFIQNIPRGGKTVMTFSDANGIASISCSCKKCNGSSFTSSPVYWNDGVLDEAVEDANPFGTEITLDDGVTPIKNGGTEYIMPSSGGKRSMKKKSKTSEPAWKLDKNSNHTKEKFVSKFKGAYEYPRSPYYLEHKGCRCLTRIGLALDKVGNRIYVADAKLFAALAVGTLYFTVTVIDECGIKTCKEVTLIFGDDKDAYYIDVKNNNYLSTLHNGDVIGYPEDPDGSINEARLVLCNPSTGAKSTLASPSSVLPPGTRFNTITGEIQVFTISDTTGGTIYTHGGIKNPIPGNTIESPVKPSSGGVFADVKSNSPGFSLFKKVVIPQKTEGVQKMTADWNMSPIDYINDGGFGGGGGGNPLGPIGNTPISTGPMVDQSPIGVGPILADLPVSSPTWIVHTGKLISGTWNITVVTRDVFNGLSIVQYTIVIKKDKIITGVSKNTGFGGLQGVKSEIKSKYGNILLSSSSSTNLVESKLDVKAVTESTKFNTQSTSSFNISKG